MAKAILEPGSVVDGFVIGERVHKGGMAIFYAVTHPDHTVPMLMKVPMLLEGEDPAAIVGFEMEQMILPRLSGRHAPRHIATGDFSAQPYLVYERIPGDTLYKKIDELPLPAEDVAALGVKIATALNDIHRQNVIHLDIKPSNIIIRDGTGEAVLIDYGLSRHLHLPDLMAEEFRLPYGTAPYMAPEQVFGIRTDPRSDLFALGCLMYFFATGRRPFGDPQSLKGLKKRLWWDPPPPRALNDRIPPWLQEIILRCLAPNPEARHPTAAQLAFDLSHPESVPLGPRAQKLKRDAWSERVKRKYHPASFRPTPLRDMATEQKISTAPIVAVAIDLTESHKDLSDSLRQTVERILTTVPDARLAVLNVRKPNLVTIDATLDEEGRSIHVQKLVQLKDWARPFAISPERMSYHVLEGLDAGAALLSYIRTNHVDHVVLGARTDARFRNILGSVSAEIVQNAPCTVTVVRKPRDYAAETATMTGDVRL
ncbi:MAG TPA: bifunctional serine/threonine-protein kinase/universal stress protein [Hyphomicrobiaceae bacterium]|nr:bifunctional serine/threonine-protein kinase/universal stress protein [Hyphomicrobiaceae bacterium]